MQYTNAQFNFLFDAEMIQNYGGGKFKDELDRKRSFLFYD